MSSFLFTGEEIVRFKKLAARDVFQVNNYVGSGEINIVEWLIEIGGRFNEWTIAHAAYSGNLELVKWLREKNCPQNQHAIGWAAQEGRLAIVEYLYVSESLSRDIMLYAAYGGQLEVIKWLRKKGNRWNSRTITFASSKGHTGLVEWLRENGCPEY